MAGIADEDDGWGDFDVPVDGAAPAAASQNEVLLQAKAELEAKLRESEARVTELQAQLTCSAESSQSKESNRQAKAELEAKLKESESRSAELQKELAVKAEAPKPEVLNLDDGWGD